VLSGSNLEAALPTSRMCALWRRTKPRLLRKTTRIC